MKSQRDMELTVETGERARWYLASDLSPERLEPLLRSLEEHRVRAVRSCVDSPGCTDESIRRAMRGSSQVIVVRERPETADSAVLQREIAIATELGLEVQTFPPGRIGSHPDWRPAAQSQPYAFLAVRIHDDFAPLRSAIVSAVEETLGIPCVWFDDPRLLTAIPGVRRRTQVAIREASLVIADLTRGPDNPHYDSPNTAHEIGMALAYERPLMVTCRAPRRDLYFSAGDQTTIFWRDENELKHLLSGWLERRRGALGLRVWRSRPRVPVLRTRHSLAEPLRSGAILRALERVHAQPESVRAIWHPLGFMDIELSSHGRSATRIHIWSDFPAAEDLAELTVHRHDWHLESLVLCGAVCSTTFDITDDAAGGERIYSIEYEGDINRLIACDRIVRTRVAAVEEIGIGQSYTLQGGVFHEITLPGKGVTATAVRAVHDPGLRNELLGPVGGREVYITRRSSCHPDSVRSAIESVLIAST